MIRRRDFDGRRCRARRLGGLRTAAPGLGGLGGADRGRRGQGVRRDRDHHRLGGRPPGARSEHLLRPEVEGAHRDRREGDRGRHRADVHQDPAGASRRLGRLRRAQRDPVLDARPGPRRRARGSRPLCRQVRLPRGAAGDRTRLPRQPDDGGRQDLWLPRRRRRLRPVLPHGRPGRSQDPGRLQGQVRQRPAGAAQDLEGVRPGRRR